MLALICHKEEINCKSHEAPASIPLQPSRSSSPLWPPGPVWSYWWCILLKSPPALRFTLLPPRLYDKAVRWRLKPAKQSGLSPPAARDWLTTHLLHAACPLLYCVSIINNNLARRTGLTVINTCQFKFVKGGYCVGGMLSEHALRLLCDKSWFLKVECLWTARHGTSEASLMNWGILKQQ